MTVTRVTLDVTAELKALFGDNFTLVKDLPEGTRVCPTCKGLGIVKKEEKFGVSDESGQIRHPLFPYAWQFFGHCPDCYWGHQELCDYCGEPVRKGYTSLGCGCEKANAELRRRREQKEFERRKYVKRVPLADYNGEMLYDDTDERYVPVTDIEDADHVYFACEPSTQWLRPDAEAVLDRIYDDSADELGDAEVGYDDMVGISDDAKEKLQQLLNDWFAEHVKIEPLYYPDKNLIVVVPEEDENDEDE